MPNTGKNIVLTLKQINSQTFQPTGLTEPNNPGDPDYIPPYNSVNCPVSNSLACPLPIFTGYSGSLGFEFSLFNSVIGNPQVSSVHINAISQSVNKGTTSFSLPNVSPNYFSGSILPLVAGLYSVSIQFLSGSTVLTTCSNTSSISIS